MIAIDWKPNDRKLRQFAVASLVGFPLIGLLITKLLSLASISPAANLILVGVIVGAVVCVLGIIAPRVILPVYVALVALAMPIGLALSLILLPLIYYIFFTPIALGLKLLGKDPMNRKMGQGETYWIKRKPAPAAANYFKQY